jgi:xanthine dehydrogenase accessory factor
MAHDFLKASCRLSAENQPFAIATVVRVEGSSSAQPGSKAVIDAGGNLISGWVGGGCAESAVRRQALECIASEKPAMITLDMTDELLGVGMPCGGLMEVYVEPMLPRPELLIVGHGRIAETLARLGSLMNFRVIVDDPAAARDTFPEADELITRDIDFSALPLGPRTYVVIATQHKGDHLSLRRALESEAPYVALISSRHRAGLILQYLAQAGVPAHDRDRVYAPAGFDIGAGTPEEIALSVMSQIVARRRGVTESNTTARRVIRECDLALPDPNHQGPQLRTPQRGGRKTHVVS